MGKRLTQGQIEELAPQCVALSARGESDNAIGKELGITHKTVKRLRENEYAKRAEVRANDVEKHLAVYTEIQRAAWDEFDSTSNRSLNKSGFLNTIKSAEDSKVKLTGAEAPEKKEHTHRHAGNDWEQEFAKLGFGSTDVEGEGEA